MAGLRPRRRGLLLVSAAVLATVVVLIAQGGASSRPSATEAVQAYVDQVRPGVQRSTEDGADFADARSNVAKLGRDGIDRRLDRLASSVQTTLTSVDALTPPPSMRVAHAYLVAALGVRLKAVTEARPAMDAALTEAPTTDGGVGAAVEALVAVGQDLVLGDRAVGLFRGAVPPRVDAPPASPWVADPAEWTAEALSPFVSFLRSSGSASPVHDLTMLAFQTDPAEVSVQPDGTEVIPASKAMTVSFVVENVGNQAEHQVEVDVVLTLTGGGAVSKRDFVDLAPGQRRSYTLQSIRTDPGTSGTLQVMVQPAPGQTDKHNVIAKAVMFR